MSDMHAEGEGEEGDNQGTDRAEDAAARALRSCALAVSRR